MIDGNLAVKADEPPDPCESNRCEWPDGCSRGAGHRVAVPGWGSLYLCRRHAGEVWAGGRPATKPDALTAARAALRDTRRRSVAVTKESITAQASPSKAAVRPAMKPESSPARAPTMADVDRACEWPDGAPCARGVRSSRRASARYGCAGAIERWRSVTPAVPGRTHGSRRKPHLRRRPFVRRCSQSLRRRPFVRR